MRNPLKQGLKRNARALTEGINAHRNAKSTKTRIETYNCIRVKWVCEIAMRNPLKQGLKLRIVVKIEEKCQIAMRNPLKQGLKLLFVLLLIV